MELLVFFECQVRGVKFCDLHEAGARWGTSLRLVKEPSNLHDPLCVAAWVPGTPKARPLMLGHVAKEAAKWLNQLRKPPYTVTRYNVGASSAYCPGVDNLPAIYMYMSCHIPHAHTLLI